MLIGLLSAATPGGKGRPVTGSLAEPAKAGAPRARIEAAMRRKRNLVTVFDMVDNPLLN
jgi:translation initiation factor 1 (eIF-1/SUI1)